MDEPMEVDTCYDVFSDHKRNEQQASSSEERIGFNIAEPMDVDEPDELLIDQEISQKPSLSQLVEDVRGERPFDPARTVQDDQSLDNNLLYVVLFGRDSITVKFLSKPYHK